MEFRLNTPILSVRSRAGLVRFAMQVFGAEGSAGRLNVRPALLEAFVNEVGRRYRRNPYHNFHHAMDVTNTVAWLNTRPMFARHLSDFHRYLLLVAALVHDVEHPGNNNQWEVSTQSPLAKAYANRSVLENHSLHVTFELIENPACDVLAPLGETRRAEAVRVLNELLIATDFAFHQEFLQRFEQRLQSGPIDFADPEFLSLVLRGIIKAADIANSAKPFPQAQVWGRRVMHEFWAQGDNEKRRRLPVGPLNDREKVDMSTAQVGFIKFAAMRLFELLSVVEPALTGCVEHLHRNAHTYERMRAAAQAAQPLPTAKAPSGKPSVK
ncbi:MAG: 3',5'-cyclic nucleotide phosphodiesterase [Candidatus Lambdaproteobacteria bacterium]|nr:3',5'-cyclic nucleotide phosphodiesterase [Candidatus Lambdaproteobacteria bacterium]